MRSFLVLSSLLFAACSGGMPTHPKTFQDSAGHSCMTDTSDISATATCDVDPGTLVTCGAGATPCFTLTPDSMTNALRNCGACCDVMSHSTTIVRTTCSVVSCTTAADCVYGNATCDSGLCLCPSGFCD